MSLKLDMKNQAIRGDIKIYFDEDVFIEMNVVELREVKPRKLKKLLLRMHDIAFRRKFFNLEDE